MNRSPVDKELIFCLQAVQMGLADSRTLVDIGLAWSRGEAQSLRAELIERCALSPEKLQLVDQTVELILSAHRGEVRASLESIGGGRVLESLGGTLEPAPAEPQTARGEDGSSPAGPTDEVTPELAGRYEMRGELGRGGIGRVLAAFDGHVGREIAIKELLIGDGRGTSVSSDRTLAASSRFLREARLTGQLEHPSIVPVYEVGRRSDGTLYYAMRLVRGRTMAEAISQAKGVEERLGLLPHFGNLCSAIAYAHSRGVLHRDIKPQNVMIGEFGETVVLDWGLAKLKGASNSEDRRFLKQMEALKQAAAGKTVMGEALGTPEYMPPEQAWGELDEVDEHSDVYSLGAVLCEILTGEPPFTGDMAFEVIGKVQAYGEGREELAPLLDREPAAPAELVAIAEKALAPHPDDRYPTAKALHDDVAAFMAGRRVGAYEYSAWELVRRLVERHRAAAGMAAALLVLLIAGSGLLANAWRTAANERAAAQANERLAHAHLADGYQEKAERLAAEHDLLGAKVFAAAALVESPFNPLGPYFDPEVSQAKLEEGQAQLASLQSTLWAASQGLVRHRARLEHESTVTASALSPDGELLASGDWNGRVTLWQVADGRRLRSFDLGEAVWALAFSGEGALLAVASGKSVRLCDAATGTEVRALALSEPARQLAFSPDGALLAVASFVSSKVALWDPARGEPGQAVDLGAEGRITELAFAADSSTLVVAGPKNAVWLWDVRRRKLLRTLEGHGDRLHGIELSPDGRFLATMGADKALRLWGLPEGNLLDTVSLGFASRYFAVHFGSEGALRAALAREQEGVDLIDLKSGHKLGEVRGHRGVVRGLLMTPDGKTLATYGLDSRINLWSLSGASEHRVYSHQRGVRQAVVSDDGRTLVTEGGGLVLWDLRAGTRLELPEIGSASGRLSISLTPDGRQLAAVDRAGLSLVDLRERKLLWSAPTGGSRAVISPAGWMAVARPEEGLIELLDVATGGSRGGLKSSTGRILALAASPDGRLLAGAGQGKGTEVWEVAGAQKVASLTSEEEAIVALAFSPDGSRLACGGGTGAIELWDLRAGTQSATLDGHTGGVRSLDFSPDGTLLASAGSTDGEVRLWDSKQARLVQIFRPTGGSRTVAFADGRTLVFGAGSDVLVVPLALELWRIEPAKLLEEAEREAAMRLTGFSLSGE